MAVKIEHLCIHLNDLVVSFEDSLSEISVALTLLPLFYLLVSDLYITGYINVELFLVYRTLWFHYYLHNFVYN